METLETTANAEVLTARVAALLFANRPTAARHLMSAARRLAPPSPRIGELAARVALAEGALDQALGELDTAVAQFPGDASLRKCRADTLLRKGDAQGALADAAEAVILDRSDAASKALLGILLLEVGRPQDAVACLCEALAAEPTNSSYHQGLAAAQEACGDVDAALTTLRAGIAAQPHRAELRNTAVLTSLRRRDFAAAYQVADTARAFGVADACCFGMMGHALSSMGRHTEAADAYSEALKLGPQDPYVRHLVAASGILPSAARAPIEYVRTVCNGYADRFEAHLVALGYRIPGLVRAALLQHPTIAAGKRLGPALDLGCGTGLIAVVLSDLPIGPFVGVDLSPRMLEAAAAKMIYTELHEADLLNLLAETATSWPLIIAADVLIYFGALDQVLAAVHAALEPGGWFIFSLEELLQHFDGTVPGNGNWALGWQGRYSHAFAYVATAAQAAGFAIRAIEHQAVRCEADAPVAGIFAVLQRAQHDA
jgi:predicted TPR repeat methyltransferase